jgi:putative exporter of polyketide antibiotics
MTALTGTTALTRLALRRDRFALPAWALGLAALMAGFTAMAAGLEEADLVQETEFTAGNPGLRIFGLASGASVGGYTMLRSYMLMAVLAGLMSMLAVVRHTRQNEETGRAELVGAASTGRYAGLAAAVVVAVCANTALAVLTGLAMTVNGQPVAASFTAGVSIGAAGAAFAGVAAITAQLSSTSRGANGLAAAVLGVSFLLAGVGNMLGTVDASGLRAQSSWPAWLSPLGWGQQMRPFDGGRWWPLALFAVLMAVLLAVACALAGRRDVSRGVFPDRRGHATAAPGLLSPLGLAMRLQRGALLGWMTGMLTLGAVMGAVGDDVKNLEGAALEWYTHMGGTDRIVDAYLTSIAAMAGMAVAAYVVQMLLRMRAEEAEGPLESLLASSVSRPRWAVSHVLNAATGAVVLLLMFAISMGLTAGQVLGDTPAQLRAMSEAVLAQLPAILVIGACVIAVTGLLPRWAGPASWSVLMASLLLGPMFAPNMDLPQWAQDISPFTHTPRAPADGITAAPVVTLLAISVTLAAAGFMSFRRRSLVLPA